jgi:hypothetical protein
VLVDLAQVTMVSFQQYEREYAASIRRQQRRNRRECVLKALDYMKTYAGPDRAATADALTKRIVYMYGDERIEAFVKASVYDLRQMYLMGLLDDTDIDVSDCTFIRDYADTASS